LLHRVGDLFELMLNSGAKKLKYTTTVTFLYKYLTTSNPV